MGTISNIMQSISTSQERSMARSVWLDAHRTLLSEGHFRRVLWTEKKRSERLSKHMILMQVSADCSSVLTQVGVTLGSVIRETDVTGWLEPNCSLGVIFTELGDCEDVRHAERIIRERIAGFLAAQTISEESRVQISFKSFCDEWTEKAPAPTEPKSATPPAKLILRTYPNLMSRPVVDSSNGVL